MSPEQADRESRNASIVLALTLPGDTVRYLLLPLYAATFGVSLPEAGLLLAANRLVRIAGYGWVGRGIASRMHGMGAHVAIVEVDPVRALEALMDGYQVMTAGQAAPWGEVFITATGNLNVFRREHFETMRDGAGGCPS